MLGRTLGHYEILEPLGEGGMGEVYRARDGRLGRDVAIKVLRRGLAGNAEVSSRFQREARTISALNHPHICVLHDIGREGDTSFLVMELVEGETLAQRLGRGPLPPRELLRYGAQIADALDRAHRAGVVHRDLKPGNVMITRAGAKLMDFGLARTFESASIAPDATALPHSPTVAHPLTAEGAILGTSQYMAPEQLEGAKADTRADLWALGCVLYEMATARRAFEGKTQASLIGAVMHTEPRSIAEFAPLAPAELERLVRACLRKDPADRVQSAHDVKLQLEWMAEGLTSTPSATASPVPRRTPRRTGLVAFAALVTIAAAIALITARVMERRDAPSENGRLMRFTLGRWDLRPQTTPLLSPDGTYVVLNGFEGTTHRLYRRPIGGHATEPIPGTDGGFAPFFSPDGEWLGFVTHDAVRKIPARGGLPQLVAAIPRINAGEWAPDDTIYLSQNVGGDGVSALFRVPATGGVVETVARLDPEKGENITWLPEVLPDGETVLLTVLGAMGRGIDAVRPDGSRVRVVDRAFLGRYVEPGFLLYLDQASEAVLAVRFDPVTLRTEGAAVQLTDRVDGVFCFDVLSYGPFVYVPAESDSESRQLLWIDRTGARSLVSDLAGRWAQPRLSPDGHRILFRRGGTSCELHLLDLQNGIHDRLVQNDDNHDPVWIADGSSILFRRNEAGETAILPIDGQRTPVIIGRGADVSIPSSWTSAGNVLVYTEIRQGSGSDLWTTSPTANAERQVFLATPFDETQPDISPDGRWIAFVSDQSGTDEVYVRAFPDTGEEWRISRNGGQSPLWSREGRELYFTSGTAMMAVPVTDDSHPRFGTPVVLFEGGFSTARARDFDVAPDGRFLTVGSVSGAAALDEVRIVLGWRGLLPAEGSAR